MRNAGAFGELRVLDPAGRPIEDRGADPNEECIAMRRVYPLFAAPRGRASETVCGGPSRPPHHRPSYAA
jgi:hypothetical protein